MTRVIALAGLLLALVTALPAAAGTGPSGTPPCFGAAARDPLHPCTNPALALTVTPTPSQALIMPNSACTPITAPVDTCTFGVPASQATGEVALIGDSHAWQWRAMVQVAADGLRWEGLSVTRFSCPFIGVPVKSLPTLKESQCLQWNAQVLAWLAQHPQVSTVVFSNSRAEISPAPGKTLLQTQVADYVRVFESFPSSVKHIVVIRDIPFATASTLPCVSSAIAAQRNADATCSLPRRVALQPDPAAIAARELGAPRLNVIDLTHYFCGARLCYPVVGGVLVYRDSFHITPVFAASAGPIFLRYLRGLIAHGFG